MKLYRSTDYVVRYAQLPTTVHGAVMFDDEGRGNIYINSRICPKKQLDALKHELRHIARNDIANGKPISEVENG